MNGPRNPDDAIEPMIVERQRRFPTQAEYDRAAAQGCDQEPDDEYPDEDERRQ